MKYDHIVKYKGMYYEAGENVPIEESIPQNQVIDEEELPFSDKELQLETNGHIYTYEELEQMTAKQMRKIAENKGFKLSKVSKDDIINEFMSKQ